MQYFGRSAWPHWGGAAAADTCAFRSKPDGVRSAYDSCSLPVRRPSAIVVAVAIRLRHRRHRRHRSHRPRRFEYLHVSAAAASRARPKPVIYTGNLLILLFQPPHLETIFSCNET